MCSVSAMVDYGRTRVAPDQWTRQSFGEFKEILKRLEALDAKLEQPDCVDPGKAKWMAAIEKRLDALET